jgi:hypothetical protein
MAGSTIDGGGGSYNTLTLSYDYTNSVGMTQIDPVTGQLVLIPPNPSNSVYDLTKVGISRVESLQASGPGAYSSTTTVIKADTASLKDFTSITLSGNAVLTTEAATFDLSGKSIYGYSGGGAVTSLNAVGTIFTVDSASVAVSIQGGAGQDTVMVKGVALTEAQRAQIFTGSVETIIDNSGTYINLDTVAPKAVLVGVSGQANYQNGHVLTGSLGVADAGLTVTIHEGATVLGTAIADSSGHFAFAFNDTKDGGSHAYSLTASATDHAGNSGVSDTFVFNFDYGANRDLFGDVVTDQGSEAGQIYALFDGLLNRAPDVSGWSSFVSTLKAGVSLHDLAQSVLTSSEFTARFGDVTQMSDKTFVDELYGIALGRGPDVAGEQKWLSELANGTSRADVSLGFALSTENAAQIAPAFQFGVFVPDAVETNVARLYYGLLDRSPDAGGQQNWVSYSKAGNALSSIAQEFLRSAEYHALHPDVQSDAQYIASLYEGALGRTPEATGQQSWLDALAHGATRAEVAVGIAESVEAHEHLLGKVEASWHLV